jgi:hypothetical protein
LEQRQAEREQDERHLVAGNIVVPVKRLLLAFADDLLPLPDHHAQANARERKAQQPQDHPEYQYQRRNKANRPF